MGTYRCVVMELAPRTALPSRPSYSRTSLRLHASQIECVERFCACVRRDSGRFLGAASVVDTLVAALPAKRILASAVRSEADIGKSLPVRGRPLSRKKDSRDDPLRTFPIQLRNESLASLKMLSAAIRRQSGAVITMSAIVRPLVDWFAGVEIDTAAIGALADLDVVLEQLLRDE